MLRHQPRLHIEEEPTAMAHDPDPRTSGTARRAFVATVVAAAVLIAAGLVVFVLHFLLLLFGGLLLAVLLGSLASFLSRHSFLPYRLALLLVVLGGLAATVLVGWLIGPRLAHQFELLGQEIPNAVHTLEGSLMKTSWGKQIVASASQRLPHALMGSGVLGRITDAFSLALSTVAAGLIALFIGVYVAVDPDLYLENGLRLVPVSHRSRAREVLAALVHGLRWWLAGRFSAMLLLGSLTIIGLAVAGVPLALPLGLIAGALFFVPYIGTFLSAVPALIIGFAVSPQKGLAVIFVFTAVHLLEGYIIVPIIQERAVSMPPALLLSMQVLMGLVGGVLGILLATPLVVVLVILIQKLYVEGYLGDKVRVLGSHGSGAEAG